MSRVLRHRKADKADTWLRKVLGQADGIKSSFEVGKVEIEEVGEPLG